MEDDAWNLFRHNIFDVNKIMRLIKITLHIWFNFESSSCRRYWGV